MSITSTLAKGGLKGITRAAKEYEKMAVQQKRATWRAVVAGRTLAAKAVRRPGFVTSRDAKRQMRAVRDRKGAAVTATRRPFPLKRARFNAKTRTVSILRWPTASGGERRAFEPARLKNGRYYALIEGRWRRLKTQSVARLWVGAERKVRARMNAVYDNHMATWIAGVRRRAGARR